uniref:Ovule protein n=1 Tax=Parascaris equorum TaxID=6256 RepID=A0A914RCU7_PAREQ
MKFFCLFTAYKAISYLMSTSHIHEGYLDHSSSLQYEELVILSLNRIRIYVGLEVFSCILPLFDIKKQRR